jgi:hypothetical protein
MYFHSNTCSKNHSSQKNCNLFYLFFRTQSLFSSYFLYSIFSYLSNFISFHVHLFIHIILIHFSFSFFIRWLNYFISHFPNFLPVPLQQFWMARDGPRKLFSHLSSTSHSTFISTSNYTRLEAHTMSWKSLKFRETWRRQTNAQINICGVASPCSTLFPVFVELVKIA